MDVVENRYVGMKSRGVYETPGGTILHAAHRALESITMDREVMHLRDSLMPRYAEMIYYGYWFAPEREVLQKAIDEAQNNVTGGCRLKLYKGNVIVAGRKVRAVALRSGSIATFEADTVYQQADAEGFIRSMRSGYGCGNRSKFKGEVKMKNCNIEKFICCGRDILKFEFSTLTFEMLSEKLSEKKDEEVLGRAIPLPEQPILVEAFTASIDIDARLYRHDIAGSIAHAQNARATRDHHEPGWSKDRPRAQSNRRRKLIGEIFFLRGRRRHPYEY